MEVIKSAESFTIIDGTFKFSDLQVTVRDEGRLYLAKSPYRESNTRDLYEVEPTRDER